MAGTSTKTQRISSLQRYFRAIALHIYNSAGEECNALGLKLVRGRAVDRFLDVGCGRGQLTMDFAAVVKPAEIYGVEYIDERRDAAIAKGINCIKADLNDPWEFPDNHFDLILSSMNISHMHSTRLYLEECLRCLKPGGQAVILTENLGSLLNMGAMALGWQPFSAAMVDGWFSGVPPFLEVTDRSAKGEYLRRWYESGVTGTVSQVRVLTYRGLRDLMLRAGFVSVQVKTRSYLPFWGPISRALGRLELRYGHFLIATGFKEQTSIP